VSARKLGFFAKFEDFASEIRFRLWGLFFAGLGFCEQIYKI